MHRLTAHINVGCKNTFICKRSWASVTVSATGVCRTRGPRSVGCGQNLTMSPRRPRLGRGFTGAHISAWPRTPHGEKLLARRRAGTGLPTAADPPGLYTPGAWMRPAPLSTARCSRDTPDDDAPRHVAATASQTTPPHARATPRPSRRGPAPSAGRFRERCALALPPRDLIGYWATANGRAV